MRFLVWPLAAIGGLLCGWVWSRAELAVVASVAGHNGLAWFRALLGCTFAFLGAVAVLGCKESEADQ